MMVGLQFWFFFVSGFDLDFFDDFSDLEKLGFGCCCLLCG
jgi:hypothetical protein